MPDFEQAALEAFRKTSRSPSCLDNFFSSFSKLYEKNWELVLKKENETNHELALALKMLFSLALEKEEEIGNSWDKLVEEIQAVKMQNSFDWELWTRIINKTARIRAKPWLFRLPDKVYGVAITWKSKYKKNQMNEIFWENHPSTCHKKHKVIDFAPNDKSILANKLSSTSLEHVFSIN